MRILIVQDTDWVRRNPIQHTHLAERLALRGHEVRVIDYEILWREEGKKSLFSRRQVFRSSRVIEGAAVTVIRPGILKIPVLDYVSMLLTYSREINRQIREFSPDVVIGNDILTTYLAFRAAKKKGIPTIFYIIDVEHRLVPFRFLQPLGKMLEAGNIRNADLVIAINEGLREYTIRMGASPDKTTVLRAGIDSERYHPGIDGGPLRKEYGISQDDTVLFFMGWLYHFSGLKEVAERLSQVENRNIKLLIVGDGDAFDDLKAIRDRNGGSDKVILTGRQPYEAIPGFIAASDICLLPGHNNEVMRDIVPIKMYEYLVMRKPVIATRLPGVMKEFGEGNGLVYVDSPEDVVPKALELVRSHSIEELGLKAEKFVAGNTWHKITDEFEEILQKVTGEM